MFNIPVWPLATYPEQFFLAYEAAYALLKLISLLPLSRDLHISEGLAGEPFSMYLVCCSPEPSSRYAFVHRYESPLSRHDATGLDMQVL